jgi:Tol biopolymer transport system component
MAVSPDLRYALVGPIDPVQDPSRPRPYEIGFYDAVKREVRGGVDLTPYTDSDQFAGWGAAWSADGRTVAIALREGLPNGGGWLVRSVVLVEVETGEVRAAAVPTANQLEPFALIGWSSDGTRLIFEADRVGTDMIPSGHLLVDPERGTSVGVTWPTQGSLARAVTGDEVAVLTAAADEIIVLNALTGQVLHRGAMSKDGINDALWRDGEIVFVDADCAGQPTVCAEATVIGRNPATGTSRVIRRLGVSAVWAWLPPAAGAALPVGLSF